MLVTGIMDLKDKGKIRLSKYEMHGSKIHKNLTI